MALSKGSVIIDLSTHLRLQQNREGRELHKRLWRLPQQKDRVQGSLILCTRGYSAVFLRALLKRLFPALHENLDDLLRGAVVVG